MNIYTYGWIILFLFVNAGVSFWFYKRIRQYKLDFVENEKTKIQNTYLNLLLNHLKETVLIVDENLNILLFSDSSLELYGFTRQEFMGMHLDRLFKQEKQKDLFQKYLHNEDFPLIFCFESIHHSKDGKTFPVEVHGKFLMILGKKHLHLVIFDISARKKSLGEMKKLSRAIEQSPTSIVITDIQGNIEFVNPKFTKLTGYSLEECIGKNPRILNAGITSKKEFESLWSTILNGKEWTGEFYNKKKNGELYVESAIITAIRNEDGYLTHFIAVKEDITDRKQAHEQLMKAKEKAEESDKLKSAFLSNMSHEIRTPMNAIIGFSEMIIRPELSQEKKERFTGLIKQRSMDLLQIIDDILDISRIEIGQMKVYDMDIFIPYLFKDLFEYYKIRLSSSEKSECLLIDMKIDPELQNRRIRTDGHRLKQLMNNLLDNAVKFTKTGKIEFGCSILSNDDLLFFVKDTGIGIAKENQNKIFDRFYQVEETQISKQFGGTGIGLTIAKGIAVLLNGSIWVESEIGKGATFYITLPYVLSSYQPEFVRTELTGVKTEWANKTILLIEDDPFSMEFLCEVISFPNMKLLKAYNALQAIALFQSNPDINLVLTDIQLPDMDGIQLTKSLKRLRPHIPIIAQTAYSSPDIISKCMNAGCSDYILKPMNKDSLISIIEKHFTTIETIIK